MYFANNCHLPCGCPLASNAETQQPIVSVTPEVCPACHTMFNVAHTYGYTAAPPRVCDHMLAANYSTDRRDSRMILEAPNAYPYAGTYHQSQNSFPRNGDPNYPAALQASRYLSDAQNRPRPPEPLYPPIQSDAYTRQELSYITPSDDSFMTDRKQTETIEDTIASRRSRLSPLPEVSRASADAIPYEGHLATASQVENADSAIPRMYTLSPSDSISCRSSRDRATSGGSKLQFSGTWFRK